MDQNNERIPTEREISLCPCKSQLNYGICCRPFHFGREKPKTAEQLMRARYSAYFFRRVEYLVETTHPDTREAGLQEELQNSIYQANWSFLTILGKTRGGAGDKTGKVEFIAEYYINGEPFELHECSRFKRFKGDWKYLDDKG